MKRNLMTLLAVVMLLGLVLLTGSHPAIAKPTGEITIAEPVSGNEIPLPAMDLAIATDWLKLIYDPLVGTSPDGRLSPETGLAEKWEMSPDGLTWTFYLRKGVKFHDGVELTAKDVKFSIEQVMRPDSKVHTAGDVRATVKSMEVKGNNTLVVYCKKPSLFLSSLLSDTGGHGGLIQPKDSYERMGHDQFIKRPIGSGPYKWHSSMVGSFIKLEATDKHWRDGEPKYQYVTFRLIPEEASRIAMLKTGEADIVRISREKLKEVRDAGLNVISKENAAHVMYQCAMQWATPAFSDVRFRKALNLAIDKEAIIKHIFAGSAKPTTSYPGAVIQAVRGIPTLKPYPYDPEQARRLIKEAGYEGFEFNMANYVRPGCPELPRLAETLCGYWEKIGLKPKLVTMEFTAWRARDQAQKTQGFVYGADSMEGPEVSEILARYRRFLHSTEPRTIVKDPKLDEMINRAEKSMNFGEVEKTIGDIYRYVYDQNFFIPICDIGYEIAVSKKIPRWDPGGRRADRNYNDLIRQR